VDGNRCGFCHSNCCAGPGPLNAALAVIRAGDTGRKGTSTNVNTLTQSRAITIKDTVKRIVVRRAAEDIVVGDDYLKV
jgi:hypothetical protein